MRPSEHPFEARRFPPTLGSAAIDPLLMGVSGTHLANMISSALFPEPSSKFGQISGVNFEPRSQWGRSSSSSQFPDLSNQGVVEPLSPQLLSMTLLDSPSLAATAGEDGPRTYNQVGGV